MSEVGIEAKPVRGDDVCVCAHTCMCTCMCVSGGGEGLEGHYFSGLPFLYQQCTAYLQNGSFVLAIATALSSHFIHLQPTLGIHVSKISDHQKA